MFHSVSCGYLFNDSLHKICLHLPLSVFPFYPTVMSENRFVLHLINNHFNTRGGCSSVGDQPGEWRVVGWSPRCWHNLEGVLAAGGGTSTHSQHCQCTLGTKAPMGPMALQWAGDSFTCTLPHPYAPMVQGRCTMETRCTVETKSK